MANKAIVQDGYNKEDPLSTVKIVSKPIPTVGPGQVVVRMTMRPINPTDFISLRNGLVGGNGSGIFGSEGCGVVHQVGEGVKSVRKGQRVVAITGLEVFKGNGAFQEYILLDEKLVWPVPDDMSDEAAAQFVINPWTSYSMLKDLQVPKGEYVIQSAANSTLGKQVILLAKHWGIKTINIVRRSEAKAELKALGADQVISSADEDVVARVKEITGGKGAWGALDAIAGSMTQTLASCVRDGGQIFVYGRLSGNVVSIDVMDLLDRNVQVAGWMLSSVLNDPVRREAYAAEVGALMIDGVIPVPRDEKYDLRDFKSALARADGAGSSFKVMLASA
jgi:trans-2-enoyl-CoA reductase